jgi:signal transduction histidine kinase
MLRSTSLRLAAVYTVIFALAVVALGAVTLYSTRRALSAQFDTRIRAESAAMVREYRSEGLDGVIQAVRERDSTPGALDFGLRGPGGKPLAGRLSGSAAPLGWSTQPGRPSDEGEKLRVLTVALPGGQTLSVGDDDEQIEVLDAAVLRGFAWAFAGVLILGVAGGYALSRGVNRRLAAISGTAEAIIDGDLTRRVPVRGAQDDLDRLALTFNRMLDRIENLMESLKQVSSDVAHDLRTPLTRLRQRLEAGLSAPQETSQALEGALGDLDSILETFAALLRIAQIEGGARRAAFRPCDLSAIAATVVEAFAPSAEDERQALTLDAASPVQVEGDPELLTQMLVNLVENALRHAGPGARIVVAASQAGEASRTLTVTDNGPGIPEIERRRVLERFYRLERSRTTAGSGLGLAMAAAVARLHGGRIDLLDAGPGLRAQVSFP